MPTYNGSKYIGQSIESCLNQTFSNLELIVVVDYRTDDATNDILQRYRDSNRLSVHTCPIQGASNALNLGFEKARGKYWTWTHDDNIYLSTAIEEMVSYMDSHPEAPMVRAGSYLINGTGRTLRRTMYIVSCFLYRREAALGTGRYRHEYKESNDIDFFMRLLHHNGPMHNLYRYLHHYRLHEGSLTTKTLGKKELTTLRLHYELIMEGIERGSIIKLFFKQISRAALYRDWETVDKIVAFGRDQNVSFLNQLIARSKFLKTPGGWFVNRVTVFLWGKTFMVRNKAIDILKLRDNYPHVIYAGDRNNK